MIHHFAAGSRSCCFRQQKITTNDGMPIAPLAMAMWMRLFPKRQVPAVALAASRNATTATTTSATSTSSWFSRSLSSSASSYNASDYYYYFHSTPPSSFATTTATWMMMRRLLRVPKTTITSITTPNSTSSNTSSSSISLLLLDLAIWLIKRTYQPSLLRKKRKCGYLKRRRTVGGRNILKRRTQKGRQRLFGA